MTDKLLMCLIFLLISGLITIIVMKVMDKVCTLPVVVLSPPIINTDPAGNDHRR